MNEPTRCYINIEEAIKMPFKIVSIGDFEATYGMWKGCQKFLIEAKNGELLYYANAVTKDIYEHKDLARHFELEKILGGGTVGRSREGIIDLSQSSGTFGGVKKEILIPHLDTLLKAYQEVVPTCKEVSLEYLKR